jgi:hypothetical protein
MFWRVTVAAATVILTPTLIRTPIPILIPTTVGTVTPISDMVDILTTTTATPTGTTVTALGILAEGRGDHLVAPGSTTIRAGDIGQCGLVGAPGSVGIATGVNAYAGQGGVAIVER